MQTPSPDFSGLWIPLITPFANDGAVDHAALARLVRLYAKAGVRGFVACGSTGEAAALDKTEQLAVLDTVLATVSDVGRPLPVIMGLSGYHLGQTQAWVRELCTRPVVGLLVPAPHYIRPSQAGLHLWFTTLADAANCPLVVYDIPYRTGATLTLDTLLTLSEHPRIRAIKDCGGDARKTQALIADGRLQVLAGEDAQLFTTLAQGGTGAITASAHLCTPAFVALVGYLQTGELDAARRIWHTLAPVVDAVFAEPNPAPLKAALAQQGLIRDGLRPPMMAANAETAQRLLAMIPMVL